MTKFKTTTKKIETRTVPFQTWKNILVEIRYLQTQRKNKIMLKVLNIFLLHLRN